MKGPKTSFGADVVVDDVVDINNNTALVDHNMGDSSVDVFEPLLDEAIGGGDGGVKVSEDGKVGWVSMMGARGSLFTLFNSSWKKFKTHFLKITLNPVYPDHINLFYKYYGETRRFPFYWQEFSQRFKSRTSPLLSPEDSSVQNYCEPATKGRNVDVIQPHNDEKSITNVDVNDKHVEKSTTLIPSNQPQDEKDVPHNTLFEKQSGGMVIRHHQGPPRRIDHVIITHDLPSLWNVDIKGFEFITTDRLLTKVDSEMMDFVRADNSLDYTKASLEDRRKIVKALNEKNSLMIGKIEIIKGIQKKIANHEKMVSMKAVENQKLVKAIESLNKNFNATVKDLEETKNTVKALND
ncbi:hypothetical protein JHK84_044006 [Glycine max]|nr:hypothetical protein JHK86_043816 [Glycine max]KAG4958104.1 hypothetical protein JHK85_044484 [Glycine max]KAG5117893.1 hypothetical protein JHK84_044006 [Glycine max]